MKEVCLSMIRFVYVCVISVSVLKMMSVEKIIEVNWKEVVFSAIDELNQNFLIEVRPVLIKVRPF